MHLADADATEPPHHWRNIASAATDDDVAPLVHTGMAEHVRLISTFEPEPADKSARAEDLLLA